MLVIILLQWLLTSTVDSTLVLSRMQEFEPKVNQSLNGFPIELFQNWELSFEVFLDVTSIQSDVIVRVQVGQLW